MNNLKVKYINFPKFLIEHMNEEFCMGWSSSNDIDAIEVKFLKFGDGIGYDEGFWVRMYDRVVYFDYMSGCYDISKQPLVTVSLEEAFSDLS